MMSFLYPFDKGLGLRLVNITTSFCSQILLDTLSNSSPVWGLASSPSPVWGLPSAGVVASPSARPTLRATLSRSSRRASFQPSSPERVFGLSGALSGSRIKSSPVLPIPFSFYVPSPSSPAVTPRVATLCIIGFSSFFHVLLLSR